MKTDFKSMIKNTSKYKLSFTLSPNPTPTHIANENQRKRKLLPFSEIKVLGLGFFRSDKFLIRTPRFGIDGRGTGEHQCH